jgi:cytochrome c oxidase cbb3-type subunit 3
MNESSRKAAPAQRRIRQAAIVLGLAGLGVLAVSEVRSYVSSRQLVSENPDSIPDNPTLVVFGNVLGRAAYAANCASCHGADMKGNPKKGIPNLADDVWLYDFGRISDIERTVLYGIRSGDARSHNVTDMPALGRHKAITPDEIKDVIAFVRSLKKGDADQSAAMRGDKIFQDKGVCYDCHSRDGSGISDYGAPNLADDDWLYGGDDDTIYKSIYDGRHGKCPAWVGKLSFPTIRALAVYIHSMSKESSDSPNRTASKDQRHG